MYQNSYFIWPLVISTLQISLVFFCYMLQIEAALLERKKQELRQRYISEALLSATEEAKKLNLTPLWHWSSFHLGFETLLQAARWQQFDSCNEIYFKTLASSSSGTVWKCSSIIMCTDFMIVLLYWSAKCAFCNNSNTQAANKFFSFFIFTVYTCLHT